jgi:endonuclease YncB( thermonuclease family)
MTEDAQMKRQLAVAGGVLALTAGLMGMSGGDTAGAADRTGSGGGARVVRWIDGDTVVTSRGTVRLIGIDTPERGRCGSVSATSLARRLAPAGSRVTLGNPASVDDQDRYGRELRYVNRGGVDVGARQIKAGAKARYDGQDGYDTHPRQAWYRGLDRTHRDYSCAPAGGGGGTGGGSGGSGGSWQDRVNRPGPDIDCGDIPSWAKPVRITGPDYHRLDADGDGWGCDS